MFFLMLLFSSIGNIIDKNSHRRSSVKKDIRRNFAKFTGKQLWQSLFFNKVAGLKACNCVKKETLAQMFSCEFCKISKNTLSCRTPPVTASVYNITYYQWYCTKASRKTLERFVSWKITPKYSSHKYFQHGLIIP